MSKIQNLSPATIDALRVGKMTDPRTPGLTIWVDPNGTKVWRYKRRVSGCSAIVKKTLGTYPAHTLAAARTWADAFNASVETGVDPREAEREAKQRQEMTVARAHTLYLEALDRGDWKALKPPMMKDKRDIWRANIKPVLGSMNLYDVTDDHLWKLVEDKGETAPVAANRVASEMKAFFGWCASRRGKRAGMALENDPARTLESKYFNEGGGRDRYLSEDEIILLFRALAGEGRIYRRVLLLLLLTAVRKLELLEAPICEFVGNEWTITRNKTDMPHRIVLGPWALALSKTNGSWLIQSSRLEDGPMISGWYKVRDRVHASIEEHAGNKILHWTLHDLRRTMRSHIRKLGVSKDAAEAMMNHAKTGVIRIYDRAEQHDKQEGFAVWEAYLTKLAVRAKVADKLDILATMPRALRTKPQPRI